MRHRELRGQAPLGLAPDIARDRGHAVSAPAYLNGRDLSDTEVAAVLAIRTVS
jgi:hypothetical protein